VSGNDIEDAPEHLRNAVLRMRTELLSYGKYRHAKRGHVLPEWKVSIVGARCALFLDAWLGGLHHLPRKSHPSDIDWSNPHMVKLADHSFYAGLSTYDGSGMTRLVLLAHDHAIRAELSASMNHMSLWLCPRSVRQSAISGRHPDLACLRAEIDRIEASKPADGAQ
jgi:hypothetical protein